MLPHSNAIFSSPFNLVWENWVIHPRRVPYRWFGSGLMRQTLPHGILFPGLWITIVGAFLTALVIAREWERGTMEMLFSTPVKPAEILLSKVIPYFIVGIGGLFLCLFAARFIFEVPIEGSLTVIIGSSCIYLLTALGAGLWISGITKNQFLASQLVIIISFLPSVMLSGFVFDLRNVPSAISAVSYVLPPTYFMELIRASFLSGTDAVTVLKDVSILAGYAFLFFFFVTRALKKTLEKK